MAKQIDDLEALRIIIQTLEKFENPDRERILRWTQEKLGITTINKSVAPQIDLSKQFAVPVEHIPGGKTTDIKAFVLAKNPVTDNQYAATIAYYYRFEAPEDQRKESITPTDLLDACRKTGRKRFKTPAQTLLNAHNAGILDKAGYGAYSLNTVGENLVAMTLPMKDTKKH